MDSYSSVRVQTSTLQALTEVAKDLSKRRNVSRPIREAKVLKGCLTLEAAMKELIRSYWRDRARKTRHLAHQRAMRHARKEIAAQVVAEDEAQWEAEGGATRRPA